jgi:hypothetical protein
MNIPKMLTFLTKKENFQSDFIVFIIIILSSFFLYFKSFFHNFIQDDYVLIESVHHGINLQNICSFMFNIPIDRFFEPFFKFYFSFEVKFFLCFTNYQTSSRLSIGFRVIPSDFTFKSSIF